MSLASPPLHERPAPPSPGRRIVELFRQVIRWWALAGGCVILGVAIYTSASAVRNLATGVPLPGEYELAMHFVAIAIFAFLPYCQLAGANVTVDILTEGMGERAKGMMAALSSVFAVAFAALLLRQMSIGFEDYIRYPEMTAILHIPLWTAFPPILISLVLLLVASLITLAEGLRQGRRPDGDRAGPG